MERVPPIIASESPLGRSAQETAKPEKYIRGSGLYCLGFESRALLMEASTQSGLTTDLRASFAASYSGKSIVVEIICVVSSIGILVPEGPRATSCPPFSLRSFAS